jgi:hypothetical protein
MGNLTWNEVAQIETDKRYMDMYGLSQLDMEDMMYEDRPYMLAMCILSDAQHLMEYDTEKARQFINKAKYVIRHMKEKSDA